MIVEQHTNMRFAWQRKDSVSQVSVQRGFTDPLNLIMVAYNVVWWVPLVLTLTKTNDYRTGFMAFLAVTIIRAVANLYRNNVLKQEQAESFPLRSP